ncbi:MAG TPA: hypothetical protein VJ867_03735, partial [Gemmatimonadaceae bacterium]|nr:hypothetical protein [Gemmatimonadaceae bacterium]
MSSRILTSRVTVVVLVLVLAGCSDTTSPTPFTPIDIALDFCTTEVPVWFAYQNLGQPWVRVAPDAAGTVHFPAGPRVAIAFEQISANHYETQIIGASNTELNAVSGVECLDENGTKTLHGAAVGATGSQVARVSMFLSTVVLPSNQATFTLSQLASRPLDLVASRENVSANTRAADRIIVRRNQNFVDNATVSTLDFNSSEAFAPGTTTIGISGADPAEVTTLTNNFFSQQQTSHLLFNGIVGNGNVAIPTIPAGQTAAGDYHDVFAIGTSADASSFRGAESYFRDPPASQILPIGPGLPTNPAFTTIQTAPYVALRMQQPISQTAAYTRAVNFTLTQQTLTVSREWTVTVTDGFWPFSNSGWDVSLPNDLSTVSGWDNTWGLQPGDEINWTVTAYYGRPTLLFGAPPSEGEGIQFAGR